MRRDFTTRKRIILGALLVLVVADLALAVYSRELSSIPQTSTQALAQQSLQLKLMQADNDRAQKIKDGIPETLKEFDRFEKTLLPASSGSSSLLAELGELARKSGVRLSDISFKPIPVPERNVNEMVIDAIIGGDYKNVIQFLNNLQRSSNNYIVESLTLATEGSTQGPANVIRVGLHIKTYLRATA